MSADRDATTITTTMPATGITSQTAARSASGRTPGTCVAVSDTAAKMANRVDVMSWPVVYACTTEKSSGTMSPMRLRWARGA